MSDAGDGGDGALRRRPDGGGDSVRRLPDDHPRPAFSPADHAQLALLLEVAGTPKPGNVDRRRDPGDLRFEQFLAGGVGAGEGLRLAAEGASVGGEPIDGEPADAPADGRTSVGGTSVGEPFERAVAGMSQQSGGNTQFGCLLLLVPLVRAAAAGDLSREGAARVTEATTVDDAAAFYRAFEHVDVAVGDPPADAPELDVRRGSDAIPALRERGLTLRDVMALSAGRDGGRGERGDAADAGEPAESTESPDPAESADGNAREWVRGFPRTFRAAESVLADDGPVVDRAARAFVDLLADPDELDTLVVTQHGVERAREVRRRARELGGDPESATPAAERIDLGAVDAVAEEFVAEGVNPGTTADAVAAALFVALERGVPV